MPNSDYVPTPVNLNNVILPEELIKLTENLARNTHEVWAKTRLEQGWKWGETRDDARKLHPCLVPYENLTEKEKEKVLQILYDLRGKRQYQLNHKLLYNQ